MSTTLVSPTFSLHTTLLASSLTLRTNSSRNSRRASTVRLLVSARSSSDYFDARQPVASPSPPPVPAAPTYNSSAPPARVYTNYSIYKGKAALSVQPRAPEFTQLEAGAFKLSREGLVLLQFAPAVGLRQYDWNKKQIFGLSTVELGALIALGANESCEFFHDPFKGKSDEGKVCKVLKVDPFPDGNGYFFKLNVQNRLQNLDESIFLPISKAEFTVLSSMFTFIIPHIVGWSAFADTIRRDDLWRFSSSKSNADLEWER